MSDPEVKSIWPQNSSTMHSSGNMPDFEPDLITINLYDARQQRGSEWCLRAGEGTTKPNSD